MKKLPYTYLSLFILRTPLLSISTFNKLFRKEEIDQKGLLSLLNDPIILESISLASPSFAMEVKHFLEDRNAFRNGEINKILLTFQKYLIRMSTRCTPFGMFAGISTGRIVNCTSITLGKGREMRVPTLPSLSNPGSRCFSLNGSLVTYSDCYRYYEQDGYHGSFQVTEIGRNEAIDAITDLPAHRKTAGSLKKSMIPFALCEENEEQFVQTLVNHQVLFREKDAIRTGNSIPSMFREMTSCTLDHSILQDITRAISFLSCFAEHKPRTRLKKFSRRFRARYGSGPVPLLTATDPEAGIPYFLAPVLTGNLIPEELFNCKQEIQQPDEGKAPNHVGRLIREMEASKQSGSQHVSLSEDIFSKDKIPSGKLPPTFSVVIELAGDQIRLHPFGGSSAANLYSRFSGTDQEIDQLVRQVVSSEEQSYPDAILAEVIPPLYQGIDQLLPSVAIRDHEIQLTRPYRMEGKHTIPAYDLWLSEDKGRLKLFSQKMGKVVIPRFTSAYNYLLHPLPLFRFLGDLQFQDVDAWFGLPEQLISRRLEMIPRVSLGKVILLPATWIFQGEKLTNLKQILEKNGNERHVKQWLSRHDLPDQVVYQFGDHELLLNLQNAACRKILAAEISDRNEVRFHESLLCRQPQQVTDGQNGFANQIIISFVKR